MSAIPPPRRPLPTADLNGEILAPQTPRETEQAFKAMTELVQEELVRKNSLWQMSMDAAAVRAQSDLQDRGAIEEQMRADYAQSLWSDVRGGASYRIPHERDALRERIAAGSHFGVAPEEIAEIQRTFEGYGRATDALEQDVRTVQGLVDAYRQQGTFSRLMEAIAEGGLAGLTVGEDKPRAYEASEEVQQILDLTLHRRYGAPSYDQMMWPSVSRTGTPLSGRPGGGVEAPEFTGRGLPYRPDRAVSLEGGPVPRETYGAELAKRAGKVLHQAAREEGFEESTLERILGGGAHLAAMFVPMGVAVRGGTAGLRTATGGLKMLRGAPTALAAELGEGGLKRLAELGVAKTALGRSLQEAGGGGAALFALGAGRPLTDQEEDRIQAEVAPENQDAARRAARLTRGLRLMATAPFYMLAGRLGAAAGGGLRGTAATTGTFQLASEATGAAEYGLRGLLEETSPEFRDAIAAKIVLDEDTRGPMTKMAAAAAARDWETFAQQGHALLESLGSNAVGFGTLHLMGAFGARRDRANTSAIVTRERFRALEEAKGWSEDPATQAELLRIVNQAADAVAPTSRERAAERTMGELAKLEPEAEVRVQDRVEAARVPGKSPDLEARAGEIAEQRREAERALLGVEQTPVASEPPPEMRPVLNILEHAQGGTSWLSEKKALEGARKGWSRDEILARHYVDLLLEDLGATETGSGAYSRVRSLLSHLRQEQLYFGGRQARVAELLEQRASEASLNATALEAEAAHLRTHGKSVFDVEGELRTALRNVGSDLPPGFFKKSTPEEAAENLQTRAERVSALAGKLADFAAKVRGHKDPTFVGKELSAGSKDYAAHLLTVREKQRQEFTARTGEEPLDWQVKLPSAGLLGQRAIKVENERLRATYRKGVAPQDRSTLERQAERLYAAEEYLNLSRLANRAADAEAPALRGQAEAWLQHHERLLRGEASQRPGPVQMKEAALRGEALQSEARMRLEEQRLPQARALLRELQAPPQGPAGKPLVPEGPAKGQPAQMLPEHREQVSRAHWGVPRTSEQLGAQVKRRAALEREAKALEPALEAVRQFPRLKGEREAALRNLPENFRPAVQEALERYPRIKTGHRLAAEALYLHLSRQAGLPTPARSLRGETKRIGAEIELLRQHPEGAVLFSAWARHRHPELQGPVGEAMTRYDPGAKVLRDIDAYHAGEVLPKANLERGPQAMGLLPYGEAIEAIRDFWTSTDRTVLSRVARWTTQLDRDLVDQHVTRWRPVTPPGLLAPLTSWLARAFPSPAGGHPLFEHPLSEFPKFAMEAGRTMAATEAVKRQLHDSLFNPKTGLFAVLGIEPAAVLGRESMATGKVPENAKQRLDYLLSDLLQGRKRGGLLGEYPENVKEAARRVRELTDALGRMAAESSNAYQEWKRELELSARTEERFRKVERDLERQAEKALEAGRSHEVIGRAMRREQELIGFTKRGSKASREAAREELAIMREQIEKAYGQAGMRSPASFRRGIKEAKKRQAFEQSHRKRVQRRMDDYVESWGFLKEGGWLHHIPFVALDRGAWKSETHGELGTSFIESITTGPARKRWWALAQQGNVDPSAARALRTYIDRIVPYIYNQRLLNRWSDQIFGQENVATRAELLQGVDTTAKGTPQYGTVIRTMSWLGARKWDHLLGTYRRQEDGSLSRKGEGKEVVLLWRGGKPEKSGRVLPATESQLADPKWVKQAEQQGDLLAVSRWQAERAILIRQGGFKQLAHPWRQRSLDEYVRNLTKTEREAWAIEEGVEGLREVDKGFKFLSYLLSSNTLGWLNHVSAANMYTGGTFINNLILGPVKAAKSQRYWWEFVRRAKKAKMEADPVTDMAIERVDVENPQAVEMFRAGYGKRLREPAKTDHDEYVNEAFEWLPTSGLLSNTRSISTWDRSRPFRAAWEPVKWEGEVFDWKKHDPFRNLTVGEKLKGAGEKTMEAGWSFFGSDPTAPFASVIGLEGNIRVALATEVYVTAREAGMSKTAAQDKAAESVILAHGVFNPALRSRFFRSGVGMLLGTVNTWASQFLGVVNRLPPLERARMWGQIMGASALAASWGLDPFDYLAPPPEDGDIGWWQSWLGQTTNVDPGQDISQVIGMQVRDIPLLGEPLNAWITNQLRNVSLQGIPWVPSWAETAADLWPAGIPMPLAMTAADSPATDMLENLIRGVEAGSYGRSGRMADSLWAVATQALLPKTVEHWRRVLDTDPYDPDDLSKGYKYRPLGSARAQHLWNRGLYQFLADLWPGQPIGQAADWNFVSLKREEKKAEEGAASDVTDRLLRLYERRHAAKEKSKAGLPAPEMREIVAEEHRLLDEYERLGGGDKSRRARELSGRALMRHKGYRVLESTVFGQRSKAGKLRALTEWLKMPTSRITRQDLDDFEGFISGQQPFRKWIDDIGLPPGMKGEYYRAYEAKFPPKEKR